MQDGDIFQGYLKLVLLGLLSLIGIGVLVRHLLGCHWLPLLDNQLLRIQPMERHTNWNGIWLDAEGGHRLRSRPESIPEAPSKTERGQINIQIYKMNKVSQPVSPPKQSFLCSFRWRKMNKDGVSVTELWTFREPTDVRLDRLLIGRPGKGSAQRQEL